MQCKCRQSATNGPKSLSGELADTEHNKLQSSTVAFTHSETGLVSAFVPEIKQPAVHLVGYNCYAMGVYEVLCELWQQDVSDLQLRAYDCITYAFSYTAIKLGMEL